MRLHILALAACALAAPAFSAHADGPPMEDGWYVERDACPGELCSMGNWLVRRDTAIYDRPFGDRAVGIARIDEKVAAETGIAYTLPMELTVIHAVDYSVYDRETRRATPMHLDVGKTLYLLTDEGEGHRKTWVDGRVVIVSTSEFMDSDSRLLDANTYRSCDTPSPDCWWRIEDGVITIHSEWWVKMRLPDGTVGWTVETDRFLNGLQ